MEGVKSDSIRSGTTDSPDGLPGTNNLRCFVCNRIGHRVIDCHVKPAGERNGYSKPAGRWVTC